MGGGDLNMKKSWHPLLLKNQERVWLEEKKALEEKKKLDQLRKEKEEERQLQELQRLQEEQTGKKRTEKLEWMYTTPATGSSQNPNDLEDYLLGKKRVDKILTADENAKIGASYKNFIAVQNANSTRDIAAKIREDPLLAIKQQEQAAYQSLLSNPLRLKKMQEDLGLKPKKDKKEKKKEKEERKRLKQERKRRKHRSKSPHRTSRTPSPSTKHFDRGRSPIDSRGRSRSRSTWECSSSSPSAPSRRYGSESRQARRRSPEYNRAHSPKRNRENEEDCHRPGSPYPSFSRDERNGNQRRRYGSPPRQVDYGKRSRSPSTRRKSPLAKRSRYSSPPTSLAQNGQSNGYTHNEANRAARLAAMQANASYMSEDRQKRLEALLEKEKADLAADDRAREKSRGLSSFISQEQKRVFGGTGGLEDRIRRGRGGMVVDAD